MFDRQPQSVTRLARHQAINQSERRASTMVTRNDHYCQQQRWSFYKGKRLAWQLYLAVPNCGETIVRSSGRGRLKRAMVENAPDRPKAVVNRRFWRRLTDLFGDVAYDSC